MMKLIILIFLSSVLYSSPDIIKKSNIIYSFFINSKYNAVAKIITAMTIQESGWYRNRSHRIRNNYFSIKDFRNAQCCTQISKTNAHQVCRPISCMRHFNTIDDANEYMLRYFTRNKYRTTPEGFYMDLQLKGYAEDPTYINRVKSVVRSIDMRKLLN